MFLTVLGTIVVLASLFIWVKVFFEHRHRRLSKQVWRLRLRVAEINSMLVETALGTEAEEFVMHLTELTSNESEMRSMHKRIIESFKKNEKQVVNLDKIILRAFGSEYAAIVKEALTKAAQASYLLGTNPLLHSQVVGEVELKKEGFGLYKELTGANFLRGGGGGDDGNGKDGDHPDRKNKEDKKVSLELTPAADLVPA